MTKQELLDCGHAASPHSSITTGYGVDRDGKKYCYACCAERDVASMKEHGDATMYLTKEDNPHAPGHKRHVITNWPGSLRFVPWHVRVGHHNIARTRYDAWFTGPDGFVWHAVQYGDNTQIAHCKRTKQQLRGDHSTDQTVARLQ